MGGVRRSIWPVAKFTALAASASGTVYLSLISSGIYGPSKPWEIASVGVAGAVSIGSSARASLRQTFSSRWAKHERAIREQLDAAILSAHELTNLRIQEVNAGLFLVSPWWLPERYRSLEQKARRGFGVQQPSPVRWVRGKGVVGECWATGRPVFRDINRTTNRYGACSAEQWEQVRPDTRMGMSFADWQATRGKYGTIVAVPVQDSDAKFVGCLALNTIVGPNLHNLQQELTDLLLGTSRLISHIVS